MTRGAAAAASESAAMAVTASAIEAGSTERAPELLRWLHEVAGADALSVTRVPLHRLSDWRFEPGTGNLVHHTGRFFAIRGLGVVTNFGPVARWMQPIIDQSEVGILGFLVGVRDGVLQFLVQRKIEPGNVNVAQLSPTVQATRSNYTRVHGGAAPPYVDYFVNADPRAVLVDELQIEQASRYTGKRNRNIVVEVDPRRVPVGPDHRWVTLGELLAAAACANAVNFDTRSVVSCLPYACPGAAPPGDDAPFAARVLRSQTADADDVRIETLRSWLAALEAQWSMTVTPLPLRDVEGWAYTGEVIAHASGRFFEVLGVSVRAATREVPVWDQPLVRSARPGIVGFLCQQQHGALRFLMRGALEPGAPRVMLGPTVRCIRDSHPAAPPFFDEIAAAPARQVRFRAVQSEEGGRFYHEQHEFIVVEWPPNEPVASPPNYAWMTLREIRTLSARYGCVSAEARSLLACLPLGW